MKNLIVLGAVAAALAGAAWKANSDPSIGQQFLATAGELEARLHGFTEKTVNAGGIAYRLYEGGDASKPALVLLHGYSADKDVWPRFASHLVNDFHIIIPDMAGHGETGFDAKWSYEVPTQADRIVALMDAINISTFHVAGNSMGGMIAATLALNYPQRVITSTPIDPAGVVSPAPSKMDTMVASGRNPFEVSNDREFEQFYSMTMAQPPYLPDFVVKGLGKTYMDRREELAVIFKDIHRRNMLDDRLPENRVPMLLIWGEKDELIDVSSVAVWKEKVPGLRVEVMQDLGHMPMVEAPKQTAALVRDFIVAQKR